MRTLLLDQANWDLCVDALGNIAAADNPYSLAQDAASASRLFAGELWYDTTQGVPYLPGIIGQPPPVGLLKAAYVTAALSVPEVAAARFFITGFAGRTLSGQIQVTDAAGATSFAVVAA